MKVGLRTPSIKKSIKARTTGKIKRKIKKSVNPFYGKKGVGFVKNPKRAIYNKVYRKTTVGVGDIIKGKGTAKVGAGAVHNSKRTNSRKYTSSKPTKVYTREELVEKWLSYPKELYVVIKVLSILCIILGIPCLLLSGIGLFLILFGVFGIAYSSKVLKVFDEQENLEDDEYIVDGEETED